MKRLVFAVVAVLAVIGGATSVIKSRSLFPFSKSGMLPIGELQSTAQIGSLPVQDFEDRSLVFSRETKQ